MSEQTFLENPTLAARLAEAKATAGNVDASAMLEKQSQWDAQDAERYQLYAAAALPQYLTDLGFPADNCLPSWERVPADYAAHAREYSDALQANVASRTGLFMGSPLGAGKTCVMALVALAARERGLRCEYVLAGWQLVEDCTAGKGAHMEANVLLVDDLDYVSTAGYEGEARSWDVIGQFLYRYSAYGGALVVSANKTYTEIGETVGMERVASRWQERIPRRYRMETDAADQRKPPMQPAPGAGAASREDGGR